MTGPEFFVLGAMKSATSWLHVCLDEHPQIYVPAGKEIDYFSYHYLRGEQWYLGLFHQAGSEMVVGEVSPSYLTAPDVPERIYSFLPEAKLIFLLRHPLERAYSHFCMDLRMGKVGPDIEKEIPAFVNLSRYYFYLESYLKLFPAQQMLVALQEDIKQDPARVLAEILSFLEVQADLLPPSTSRIVHQKKPRPKFDRLYALLYKTKQRQLAGRGLAVRFYDGLQRLGLIDTLHRLLPRQEYPKLTEGAAQKLVASYTRDVEDLSRWLDRDLSGWLKVPEGFSGLQD